GWLTAIDRERQQGRDQSRLPWREPARRLWPGACSRCREHQGREAVRAMDFNRNLVEVDRRARQGIRNRETLSRQGSTAHCAHRRQRICRSPPGELETRGTVNKEAPPKACGCALMSPRARGLK